MDNEAGAESSPVGEDGHGGGIFITSTAGAVIQQTTLTNNRAGDAAGGIGGLGGGICVTNTTLALSNSIVDANQGAAGAIDGFGSLASPKFNLFGTTAGWIVTGSPAGNVNNVSAMLGALADHGGATDTCLPAPGSPAIDAANLALVGAAFVDQRGVSRLAPQAPGDIGAVETTDDFDSDGLPDTYEVANGMNFQDPADASLDFDSDTVANLDERTTGTNPQDASSVFRVAAHAITGGAEIRFQTFSGRLYTLQRSTTGPDGTYLNVPGSVNLPGTGGMLILPQTGAALTQYFTVRVTIAP